MKAFEELLIQTVKEIRTQLQDIEGLNSFEFTIKTEGRVHDGDLKIEFKLEHGYYEALTKGHSIGAVLDEFKRRVGWNEKNTPLMISNTEEKDLAGQFVSQEEVEEAEEAAKERGE